MQVFECLFVQVGYLLAFTDDCPAVRISSICPRSRVPFPVCSCLSRLVACLRDGCPSHVRHTLRPICRASSPLRLAPLCPYLGTERGQNMEAPCLSSPVLPDIFGSATRGRWKFGLDTPQIGLTGLPQGCLFPRFRGFGYRFVPVGLYRVELFILDIYMPKTPPPGAISPAFAERPRRIWRC